MNFRRTEEATTSAGLSVCKYQIIVTIQHLHSSNLPNSYKSSLILFL